MRGCPNILMIVADDHRADFVGAGGQPWVQTPALDGLAGRGFSFRRHFTTTPICTPARAEFLTGRTTFDNGVPWFGCPIRPDLALLPRVLREAGYHTIHVGKWHNDGHPRDRGYDVTDCAFIQDNLNEYGRCGHQMRFAGEGGEVAGHSTELIADATERDLRAAPADRPWFCFVGFHSPHDPFDCPEPWASRYRAQDVPLPPDYLPEHPFDNGEMTIRDELLLPHPRTQEQVRQYRARYAAMVTHHDDAVRRMLDAVESRGEADRTLVIYTSDHGLAVGSHGLLGKESMYDHSISIPLIFAGPGVPRGASHAMTHHVDLLPTICECAGVERPASATDGVPLTPLWAGDTDRVRDELIFNFQSPDDDGALVATQRAIRTEKWKLAVYPLTGEAQLFDLEHDPLEMRNLLAPWRLREGTRDRRWRPDRWATLPETPDLSADQARAIAADLMARLTAALRSRGDDLWTDAAAAALSDRIGVAVSSL